MRQLYTAYDRDGKYPSGRNPIQATGVKTILPIPCMAGCGPAPAPALVAWVSIMDVQSHSWLMTTDNVAAGHRQKFAVIIEHDPGLEIDMDQKEVN